LNAKAASTWNTQINRDKEPDMDTLASVRRLTAYAGVIFALSAIGAEQALAAQNPIGPGYLLDSSGNPVRDRYGECWRTAEWTPARATPQCDPQLVKAQAKVAETEPAPASVAAPPTGPEKPLFERKTLEVKTLFGFDKATLRPEGRILLDDIVAKMKRYPEIQMILVSGYTDRIGSDAYNIGLSQRRAHTVKDYLVEHGIEGSRIETQGEGKADPVVTCDDVKGKANRFNKKLIACLQPDRRVVVEVKVQRPISVSRMN
jgi:OOP family OmpA-OmpF porin